MTHRLDSTVISSIMEILMKDGTTGMRQVMELLLNETMRSERELHLQAAPYERTALRQGHANGFKPKSLKTRIGSLDLQVPQVRDSDFYPSCLEKGMRSERALLLSLAEMYVQGVSTRKVTEIVKELCGDEVSSAQVSRAAKLLDGPIASWRNRPLGSIVYLYLDAHYQKVRHDDKVIDVAILVATGVDKEGRRQLLGFSVDFSEAEVHWRAFLESLIARGMQGLQMIISDAHSGLKEARRAVFPSVPWQRCQFHLQQNAQAYVPHKSMKPDVANSIRHIFNASSRVDAERLLKEAVIHYAEKAPRLSAWMEGNLPEGFSVFHFPESHWKRLRTDNLPERMHKEIRRRTHVVGIFPNTDSCVRLIGAILMEISEGWETGNRYLQME